MHAESLCCICCSRQAALGLLDSPWNLREVIQSLFFISKLISVAGTVLWLPAKYAASSPHFCRRAGLQEVCRGSTPDRPPDRPWSTASDSSVMLAGVGCTCLPDIPQSIFHVFDPEPVKPAMTRAAVVGCGIAAFDLGPQ